MLLGAGRHRSELISAQDSVHNYYEHLVIEQLLRANDRASQDPEFMADVCCVALNRLPPRYVRHDVDMTFFLSPAEMDEMDDKIAKAVNDAVTYVLERESNKQQTTVANQTQVASSNNSENTAEE